MVRVRVRVRPPGVVLEVLDHLYKGHEDADGSKKQTHLDVGGSYDYRAMRFNL